MRILYLSMKLVSQGAQYAISAIIALSKKEYGKAVSAADLAKALDCPAAYLSQLLSKLKKPGILKSQRGLNGGVLLAKPVKEISIYDVIVAWELKDVGILNLARFIIFGQINGKKLKNG